MNAGRFEANTELVKNFNRTFGKLQDGAAAKLRVRNWQRGCFHDLRKSFGTRAASAGVPMHELQRHMWHSTIMTTAAYYTEVEKAAADRLRAVFTCAA